MNIFFFDRDPVKCAQDLCDKHVVKMTTETVQIISTAYFILTKTNGVYKPTHIHHPCVIWATKSYNNLKWLCEYAFALGNEYTKRYNKQHLAITKLINWLNTVEGSLVGLYYVELTWTDPPQCMPIQYNNLDATKAYKDYYIGEKLKFAVWKYSNKPVWLN